MHIDFLWELLRDDVGYGDITSSILPDIIANASVVTREDIVVAGIGAVEELLLGNGIEVQVFFNDGERAKSGARLMLMTGKARDMLTVERTMLNMLQRMCGIATITRECVEIAGPSVRIAATRKSILPYYDKMAVIAGGGDPHRWGLYDMFLIKDNHIAILGITEAVKRAKAQSFTKKIEVEVEDLMQALEAAEAGADIIMLDNMDPPRISETISALREQGHENVVFEASGGVTPDNLAEYAKSGVDVISMGFLTHSVRAVDIALEVNGD